MSRDLQVEGDVDGGGTLVGPGLLQTGQLPDHPISLDHERDVARLGLLECHWGPEGWADGPDPERRKYGSYSSFTDPDGNSSILQEV